MNNVIDLRELTDKHLDEVIADMARKNKQEVLNILLKEKDLRLKDPYHEHEQA